jgi:hypothetical protein
MKPTLTRELTPELTAKRSKTARTASRLLGSAGLLACLAAGAGCGNYSNEDLDFVSAIPQTADVSVEAPRQSPIRPAAEDDALQTTTDVTRKMNASAAGLLALVDQIRSFYPTSRNGNQRSWGPAPADNNPGWQFEFTMTKAPGTTIAPTRFDYSLSMIPPGAAPTGALSVLTGWFIAAAGGVGTGMGHVDLTPAAARDAGAIFPGLEKLMSLGIDYNAGGWPRTLTMKIVSVPSVDPTVDATNATYIYERDANGDGTMSFTFLKDVVPGPAGIDTLSITSHWLGAGPGRSDVAVIAGDGAGLISWTDCWDATSTTSYDSRTAVGDPSACISIP